MTPLQRQCSQPQSGYGSAGSALSPAQVVQLTRAWLIVEGIHDEMIVRHFYGAELRRERVSLLPLLGVNEALALVELGLLASFQVPLILLFDNVRASWIELGEKPPGRPSHEEKMLDQLMRLNTEPQVDLRPVAFPFPDIIRALPEEAIRRTLAECYRGRSAPFPGWVALDAEYDQAGRPANFKRFLLAKLQLGSVDPTVFIHEVLTRSDVQAAAPELHQAVERALTATTGSGSE